MDDEIEDFDSKNKETDQEDNLETTDEDETEDIETEDDSEDVDALKEKNRQLFARAKKAEGFVLQEGKWIKKSKPVIEKPKEPVIPSKSNDIDKLIDAKLEKRELDSLDLSDKLKKEVQTYANLNKISIKNALGSEYISFLKDKEEKNEKANNASITSGRKTVTRKDFSDFKASDYDMTTAEGRERYAKDKEEYKKQLG